MAGKKKVCRFHSQEGDQAGIPREEIGTGAMLTKKELEKKRSGIGHYCGSPRKKSRRDPEKTKPSPAERGIIA